MRSSDLKICIAGKNDIASNCLLLLLDYYNPTQLCIVCNKDDTGKHTWQKSLRFTAKNHQVEELTLSQVQKIPDILFLSLEFDRIIRTELFKSKRLFNIHFSKLPAYRGVNTAVWPILDGLTEAGVTLHCIDTGIDTGPIIAQRCFDIPITWTSRDLYLAFIKHGTELFSESIPKLMSGGVTAMEQPFAGATYHHRSEIDFKNLPLQLNGTAYQAHNSLRAFTFWEYQLPSLGDIQVLSTTITSIKSTRPAGTLISESPYISKLSTRDYDLKIVHNVYTPLFSWAEGTLTSISPEVFTHILDIDLPDKNGWNALAMASWHGQEQAAIELLQHGANVSFANKRGTTILMYAVSHAEISGNMSLVRLLLKAGADAKAKDAMGLTVIEHLELRKSFSTLQKMEKIL